MSDEQETVYQVQSIVSSRLNKGRKQYLVKWVGYESSENTWEPQANLINSKQLLEEFKKNENKKFIKCEKPVSNTRSKKQLQSPKRNDRAQQGQMKGRIYSRDYSSQSQMVRPEQNCEVFQQYQQPSEQSEFSGKEHRNSRKPKITEKKDKKDKSQNENKRKKSNQQNEKFKILGIQRGEKDTIYYYVRSNKAERWVNRRYFSTTELEQLCNYYQKNMKI